MEPVTLTAFKVKSSIRLRRRLRLKLWWERKRMTPFERELYDAFSERITDAFINGTPNIPVRDV